MPETNNNFSGHAQMNGSSPSSQDFEATHAKQGYRFWGRSLSV